MTVFIPLWKPVCLSHEIPWHPIPGESSGGAALTSHRGRHRRCATWPRQLYLRPLRLLVSWLEHVQQTAGRCFLSWKKYGEIFWENKGEISIFFQVTGGFFSKIIEVNGFLFITNYYQTAIKPAINMHKAALRCHEKWLGDLWIIFPAINSSIRNFKMPCYMFDDKLSGNWI